MANVYSFVFNGAPGDYTNADLYLSVDGAAPTLVPSTINTYGTGGDYADPILAAAAVGGIDDGKLRVCVQISDVTMNALFRPNQTWPNGGLMIGDIFLTGEIGVGRVLANQAASRFCLAPSPNIEFCDLRVSDGGVTKTAIFQSISGNLFTRIIAMDVAASGSVNPLPDTTGTTINNCALSSVNQTGSSVAGDVTVNNCYIQERIICRTNNLLTIKNSISQAADWYLGRPFDSGAETLVNYCKIFQNAPADEFGPGSSNYTVNVDSSAEFVDLAGGDYRIKSTSPYATAGDTGGVLGPFLEVSAGLLVTGNTANFNYNAVTGSVDLTGSIEVTGSTASFDYNAITGSVDLTGEILITGQTANFDYTATPADIDLTGEITVTGATSNFDYIGVNGVIELGAVINVVGQTANFDVNGVKAEVSLTGEIIVTGQTAVFNYTATTGNVIIGAGQKFGVVTSSFADSVISVQYKQDTITVKFGE